MPEALGFMKFVLLWTLGLVAMVLGFILVHSRLTREQAHDLLKSLIDLPHDVAKWAFRISKLLLDNLPIEKSQVWGKVIEIGHWILDKRKPIP